jgi:hypothetical protein
MSTNGTSVDQPAVVRRLEGPSANLLGGLVATFEELQMTLRCCERLVVELSADEPDDIVVEAVWTTALLSYARCFAEPSAGGRLTTEDLTASMPEGDVLEWHEVLVRLRDHYADPADNPRERFTVAVTQDDDGSASGVAITSARQPLVDDLTVRQTGAIAYALSGLVNERIEAQQLVVSTELEAASRTDLDKLDRVEIAAASPGS